MLWTVTRSPLPVGKGFWKPLTQWAQSNMYSYNSSITPREYNPTKAKNLLAAAGYPNGFSTNFYAYHSTDPTYCDALQSYLGAVGINTKVNMITGTVNSQLMSVTGWNGLMNGNCGVWGRKFWRECSSIMAVIRMSASTNRLSSCLC